MTAPLHPPAAWIAVAAADHVALGRAEGFAQVNHGKAAPLRRMRPGDALIYYAPVRSFGGKDRLQAFVAYGRIANGPAYQGVMAAGFTPFRRDVLWNAQAREAPIQPLLPHLSFTAGRPNWGAPFRFGLFQIANGDRLILAKAMGLSPDA